MVNAFNPKDFYACTRLFRESPLDGHVGSIVITSYTIRYILSHPHSCKGM